ncbi:polyphosphate kinase [Paenibacillus baekrokdamisoli]|uniref:Polyphosphate kinase n=1 Tax=Paenibacillus baekrokdamisoli TaxID=1712516 RepID=A0A3G9JFC5_9BACL|nr:PPK2 family polyphosphate kinase [Paenibacillus baekrokdamisoli]MBB3068209.1 PPK2 family polyphosphate:nucleotide phosphotransferase [Paenibacillus baekrokdamisoli]BBH22748.1 polyphosphate kinase [Paenibacillus baekrokdamisoli]
MLKGYRLDSKRSISLGDYNPEDTADFKDKEEIAEAFEKLKEQLQDEQEKLFASKANSVLILFQGMDCSGKDGVIRKVLGGLNPQGFRAESFKQPTADEAAHDFLWRTHKVTPPKGYITAFNRSYYEEVLITKVHGLIDQEEVDKRLKHIQHFEKLLLDNGTLVIKLFLHISPEFQLDKIKERMENPEKLWKFDPSDLQERRYWKDYMKAYQHAFKSTGTKRNPWYIVPANHRWFRDYLVLRIIVSSLRELNLSYPKIDLSHFNSFDEKGSPELITPNNS